MGGTGRRGAPDGGRHGDVGSFGDTLDIIDITSPLSQAVLQETRLRLLAILGSAEAHRRGGYSLQELGQMLDCSAQNAHHHLKILEREGAVHVARTEATQRIPRQFWLSDVRRIRLRPWEGSLLELDAAISERDRRRLSRRLEEWARAHGMDGHKEAAVQVGTFIASLGGRAAKELLDALDEIRQTES